MQGHSVKKAIPFVRQGKLISFWIRSLSKKSIEYLKMGRVDYLGSAHICIIEAQTQLRTCLGVIPYFLLNMRLKFDRFENPHFCEISRIESLVDVSIARASVTRKSFTYEIKLIPVVVFYLCAQKYIVKGVAAGAVKG